MVELEDFWKACEAKFEMKGKDGNNRSDRPWEYFDYDFLLERLHDEDSEFDEVLYEDDSTDEDAMNELLDKALTSAFLWLKLKQHVDKREPKSCQCMGPCKCGYRCENCGSKEEECGCE